MTSYGYASAWDLSRLIAEKQVSPLELMEATLQRMTSVNGKLNAFVALQPEKAMEEARAMTESMARGGSHGPLAGIPVGVKD
ncbi:MAG: hypothetical protein KAH09_04370, partial [Desulfobacula sp.]|nr:hypothetical protein [Desulfobacula sp.]